MLALFSGVDVYSVTIIVAAFMLGLGCGSLAGGHLADRLSRRRLLQLFALSELLVGGFALCSKWLYYDVLYTAHPQLAASPVVMAAVLFGSLLFPTLFMGLTLPMLSKALTRSTPEAARRIGALYALNTLGSAVGALVTAVVLVRRFGFEPSLRVGAALNGAAAVGALGVLWLSARRDESAAAAPSPAANAELGFAVHEAPAASPGPSAGPGFSAWLAIYALSGFIALGLEIVWFRLLGVMLKSNAFTFAVLLCLYLLGVGGGTLLGLRGAPSCRQPARRFLLLQAGVTLYAGLSLALLVRLVGEWGALDPIYNHFARGRPMSFPFALADVTREFVLLYGVIAPLLILPPTLLMGASFPYLQKASQTDLARLGRRVGWLQTANILGATVGVVVVGALLLGWLGTPGTLRVMIGLGLVFLLLWWRLRAERPPAVRRAGAAASAAAVALVMALVPASPTLWGKLHGSTAERVLFSEDATGLSVIKSAAPDFSGTCTIYANGVGQSSVPFGGVHTELGLLSVALHPAPADVAIIGLGSGDTLFAAGGRAETRSLTSIEIIGPELETLRQLHARRPYGGLASIFEDERIRHVFTDGRSMILRGEARYDVIEADAVIPVSADSGNLYSEEYFALLRQRLKPGGFAVTWSPSPRTRNSFIKVFPHVAGFESLLVGSESPIVFDEQEVLARLDRPGVRERYAQAGIDAHAMLQRLLKTYLAAPPDFDRSKVRDTNSDLFPRDEFAVP